jgi:AcrR family transcriptional regulator
VGEAGDTAGTTGGGADDPAPVGRRAVREIATSAGVQHSLVFRHFGDKDGLVHDAVVHYLEALEAQVVSFRDLDDALDQLLVLGRDPQARAMLRILVEGYPFPVEVRTPPLIHHVVDLVAARQATAGGSPRFDPLVIALTLFNCLSGLPLFETLNALSLRSEGMDPATFEEGQRALLRAWLHWAATATTEDPADP